MSDARRQSVANLRRTRRSGTPPNPSAQAPWDSPHPASTTRTTKFHEKKVLTVTVKEMIERRLKIHKEMTDLTAKTPLSKEDLAKFNALDAEQEQLKSSIDAANRAAALEVETRSSVRPPNGQPGGGDSEDDASKEEEEKYRKAWHMFMRYGIEANQHEPGISDPEVRSLLLKRRQKLERRDTTPGWTEGVLGGAYPGAATGFFVPVGFVKKIEEALKWYGGMFGGGKGDPEIMETATGQPLPYPTDNDTQVMGQLIGEGTQVSEQDVNIGMLMFGAWKYTTGIVRISIELLQDSAFDLEAYLAKKFAIRIGRITNNHFTVGTGNNQPLGILTAATLGVGPNTNPAIIGDDNQTTPDPGVQFGWIDLTNLEHSVDKAYRQDAKYMLNDTSVRFAKTLKDKYGRLLWAPAVSAGAPDTINAHPFLTNNDMPQIGYGGSPVTGNKSVLFGAVDRYLIRRVRDLSIIRLAERYADYGQVAFLGFCRYDGNLLDAGTHPVKYLQHATS
jgi:HK97 family phage major capsid protein